MIRHGYFVIIFVIFIFNFVCSQRSIDDPCILDSSGSPGVCKLLTQCQHARDEVVKFHRLPQTCGFQGTQPIACCPTGEKRKPGAISKIRCKKYSSYASESTPNECAHKIVKRISEGVTASRKEFAHMAAIGLEVGSDKIRWVCGGSIISEQYILTAARCLIFFIDLHSTFVQVGVSTRNDTNHRQRFKIEESILHPNYVFSSQYNDIALIKLNGTINFNPYVRPACLYTEAEIRGDKAIATGWGLIQQTPESVSHDLQKVTLNFVSHDICDVSLGMVPWRSVENGIMDETQVCAGSGGQEKDICQGVSGGPLQIYHEDGGDILCMYDIVGINSFATGCSGKPGVYTRISHYVKWIENTIWPASA